MAYRSSLDFMIVLVMNKSVSTVGDAYIEGEVYVVEPILARHFIARGWANPASEATAIEPAKRTATKNRIRKR